MEHVNKLTFNKDNEEDKIERALNEAVLQAMLNAVELGIRRPDYGIAGEEPIVKACPLCDSPCRYLNINLRDQVLMCENRECEYPYGHEELQIIRDKRWTPADNVNLSKIIPGMALNEDELKEIADNGDEQFTSTQARQVMMVQKLHEANEKGFGLE